jgi:MSHA pilin protein MshA
MENRRNFLKNQQGFTLVEIIAVLVILGILSAVAVPKFLDMQDEARERAAQGALAAAVSNVTMSYSKFLLQENKTPTGITANNTWDGGSGAPITIEKELGDFTASYTKVDEGVEVSLTTSTNFVIDDLDKEFTKKTVKLEFGTAASGS